MSLYNVSDKTVYKYIYMYTEKTFWVEKHLHIDLLIKLTTLFSIKLLQSPTSKPDHLGWSHGWSTWEFSVLVKQGNDTVPLPGLSDSRSSPPERNAHDSFPLFQIIVPM